MTRHRLSIGLALGLALATTTLGACSSDTAKSADTTATTAPASTEASTTAPATTEPATTLADTTTTTAATTTTKPAITGPTVTSLSTSQKNPTCAEVTANGYQWKVSWKAVNVDSVTLSIDGLGSYAEGLPATGSFDIPATCGDTQVVYITPVNGGTSGTPKKITITIGS